MKADRIEDDWIPTRQSLLSRLRDWDDRDSWQDFFDTYGKLIHNAARKSGLSEVESQEVVQETVITVAKKISGFRYDPEKGSFKGWLLRTTQWRIADQFRKRRPHLSLDVGGPNGGFEDGENQLPLEALGIASKWDNLWTENLVEVAMDRIKKKEDPKEFQIFDLIVRRDWTPLKVAQKMHMTRAHVYYIKHKISRALRKEMSALESGGTLVEARD